MSAPTDPVKILSALEGLPLWGANRAVDMAMFQFGARHRSEHRRRLGEHGDHALHVQCPWVLEVEARAVVASDDSFERRDRVLREALDTPEVVRAVALGSDGKLAITLASGASLRLTPLTDRLDDHEDWRFFAPGTDQPHLVRHPTGFSLE